MSILPALSDIDRVTQKYLLRYPIHLENALSELGDTHTLTPFIEENPYKETVATLRDMAQIVNHGDPDHLPLVNCGPQRKGTVGKLEKSHRFHT